MAEQNKPLTVDDVLAMESSVASSVNEGLAKRDRNVQAVEELAASGHKFNLAELQGFLGGNLNETKNLQESSDELARLRDAGQLEKDLLAAKAGGDDEDILKSSQEVLRLKEFEQSIGTQLEAEQLAQRTLFRESQQLMRQQAQLETSGQQSAASALNRAAQTGISNSSAIQGMVSSIRTQVGVGVSDFQTQQGDIRADQTRIATNLTNDLQFLNETFDLGGDISAASQNIANRQAKDARDAARQQQKAQIGSTLGGIGGSILGGPVGGAVGSAIGSAVGSFF